MENFKKALMVVFLVGFATAANYQVNMYNFYFDPESLSIQEGDTVTWVNQTSISHTTTSGTNCVPDGQWDSGLMGPGETFSAQFLTVGDYPYFCIPHCDFGMIGFIHVSEGNAVGERLGIEKDFEFSYDPNPFRDKLNLRYTLTQKNFVKIEVLDASGRTVSVLDRGVKEAGSYNLQWNAFTRKGSPLRGGIYFLKIQVGEEVKIVKLSLLR
jgi:plastocyanin